MKFNIGTIIQLIQLLPALIKLVESIFGKGSGTEKKAAVKVLIPLALGLATDLSKGGQKDDLRDIATNPALDPAIDALAGMIFPSGSTIVDMKPAD